MEFCANNPQDWGAGWRGVLPHPCVDMHLAGCDQPRSW